MGFNGGTLVCVYNTFKYLICIHGVRTCIIIIILRTPTQLVFGSVYVCVVSIYQHYVPIIYRHCPHYFFVI